MRWRKRQVTYEFTLVKNGVGIGTYRITVQISNPDHTFQIVKVIWSGKRITCGSGTYRIRKVDCINMRIEVE